MILLLGGTKDSRELVSLLVENKIPLIVSVTSQYGADLIQENVIINKNALDKEELLLFCQLHRISLIIDASHPYAKNVSKNAIEVCSTLHIPYVRYERPCAKLPDYPKLHQVNSYVEAANLAGQLGKNIFLTTGSRNLTLFRQSLALETCRLIARVLPEPSVIAECINLGFQPSDIVALQGPFTYELNIALFKAYEADVIVTKNSGLVGGTDEKLSAAIELNLSVIIINRPTIIYPNLFTSLDEVLSFVRRNHTLCIL